MTKTTGLGDNLYVGGYDLSGDTRQLRQIGGGPALLPVTGINSSGVERLGGLLDGAIAFESFFNKAAGQAHPVLSALPTADVVVSYFRGTTVGNAAASLNGKQVGYDGVRNDDGSLYLTVEAVADEYGIEMGRMLTPGVRTDSGAANGTGYDYGASSSYGLQAYLHVFDFTGTDVTIKLQESSDDGSGDAYADVTGGGFASVTTAPQVQRIQTATNLTVEQWLRVATATSGGFTDVDFAVMVVRNEVTPVLI